MDLKGLEGFLVGWIGVDLDGTLAKYNGWADGKIGEPIPLMVNNVRRWLADGWEIRIFTARMSARSEEDVAQQTQLIEEWCEKHLGQKLPVTCTKDYGMIELYDDRAYHVTPNTGVIQWPLESKHHE